MSGFIKGVCKTDDKVHSKVGECSMFEGTPYGFIFHDKNKTFSTDETAFNTEIKAAIIALGINRVTPLMGVLTDYQLTGGDVKTSQEGFGPEVPIGINAKRVDYIINVGGLCLLKQLKKLNGREVRVFLVDNNKVAYGTEINQDGPKFRGFLASVYVTKRDNTGTQNPAIILSIFFSADYENEETNMAAITLSEAYEGLTGVTLRKTATGRAKFVIACSGDDLTQTYGATLAVATLYKDPTGTNPTAVTYSTTTEDLQFTPVGSYAIADAVVLDAANIEGYEGENEYVDLA